MRKSILEIAGYDQHAPAAAGALSDAAEFATLMDALVAIRQGSNVTQSEVANRMGTKQSAISELEATGANPRIRTLFRYARAVGADLRFRTPTVRAVGFSTQRTIATGATVGQALEPIVAPSGQAVTSPIAA